MASLADPLTVVETYNLKVRDLAFAPGLPAWLDTVTEGSSL